MARETPENRSQAVVLAHQLDLASLSAQLTGPQRAELQQSLNTLRTVLKAELEGVDEQVEQEARTKRWRQREKIRQGLLRKRVKIPLAELLV